MPDSESVLLDKLKLICDIRQENEADVRSRFSIAEISAAPKKFSQHITAMYGAPFVDSGVIDGSPFVKMANGRIFFGRMPANNHRKMFRCVQDLLPSSIIEEAFLIAHDVTVRYLKKAPWPPKDICPPTNGLIVECGAYLGHKTISFADQLITGDGLIVAIEMIPGNVEILRKNINANGLEKKILVAPYGVWNEDTKSKLFSKGWQRNSLVNIGRLDQSDSEVDVRRVETIITEMGLQDRDIDLAYVTVNGAELEALEGFGSLWPRLKAAFVVSNYPVEGEIKNQKCRDLLLRNGLKPMEESPYHLIAAHRL